MRGLVTEWGGRKEKGGEEGGKEKGREGWREGKIEGSTGEGRRETEEGEREKKAKSEISSRWYLYSY